jgi:hypothetical protein
MEHVRGKIRSIGRDGVYGPLKAKNWNINKHT